MIDGRSRVDGVALGASGFITPRWSIFANYTWLDGEVRQSVSDFCLANPGGAGCANSAALPDPQRGDRLSDAAPFGQPVTTYRFGFGSSSATASPTRQLRHPSRKPAPADPIFAKDYLIHRLYSLIR